MRDNDNWYSLGIQLLVLLLEVATDESDEKIQFVYFVSRKGGTSMHTST